jgi:hypothetical protein
MPRQRPAGAAIDPQVSKERLSRTAYSGCILASDRRGSRPHGRAVSGESDELSAEEGSASRAVAEARLAAVRRTLAEAEIREHFTLTPEELSALEGYALRVPLDRSTASELAQLQHDAAEAEAKETYYRRHTRDVLFPDDNALFREMMSTRHPNWPFSATMRQLRKPISLLNDATLSSVGQRLGGEKGRL